MKYEYIGEQSITLHGIGEAGAPMSDYLRHEALDRTHLLIDMIGSYLLDHEFIKADDELFARVSQAQALLCDVYQDIGRQHMPGEPA